MRRLLKDDKRANDIESALQDQSPERCFKGKELALISYTGILTSTPGEVSASDVESAKSLGATDGEILEVNQVCAYFCYSNRTLNGLGVTLSGDSVGYYTK